MSQIPDYSLTPMAAQLKQSPIRPRFTPINREESSSEDKPAERTTPERDVRLGDEGKDQAVDTSVNEDDPTSSTIPAPSIIKLGKRKRVNHDTDKPANTEFVKRTLQRASLLSSSPDPEGSASPLRGGRGKAAPHQKSAIKASSKFTCTLCEVQGIECTPHRKQPRKWRCDQCNLANVRSSLCKIKVLNSSPAPDNTKPPTPSSTYRAAGSKASPNLNPRTTTDETKTARTKPQTPATQTPKQNPSPAKARLPFLNSVISLLNPAVTEIKFLADKYQANFNDTARPEPHEYRSMSRLLWLTHLELGDTLNRVQRLEREVQALKREREDWKREKRKVVGALGRMSEIGAQSLGGSFEGADEVVI